MTPPKIALTGFMGVGKSSVARHLSGLIHARRIDLDHAIEHSTGSSVAHYIDTNGIDAYRDVETATLREVLSSGFSGILSLGGGTWTMERNREMLRDHGFSTVWLEATFEHCWLNVSFSRKDRPLARDKNAAFKLFEERQSVYCLAEWRFAIRSDLTSYDVAQQIRDEIFNDF